MIVDIEKEKEGKDENLLANLCECYVSLSILIQFELAPICVPCLLKVALKKEESEETQTEVELALLALTCFDHFELDKELYLKEVIEIIQYHREHRNLTYLAHHSAWKFLIDRISFQSSSESKIVSEHHFARDAGRELDELSKHIDWKKKEEEEEGERETKDEIVLMEWLRTSSSFFATCGFLTDEFFGLLSSAVGVFRLAYDCNKEINDRCMYLFKEAALNMHVKAEDLIESGAVDVVLEKIIQLDTTNELLTYYLLFFKRLSKRLNEALVGDIHEANRRALQKKIFEKLEEEGYEDCIIGLSLCMIQDTFYEDYFIRKLARLLVLL
ncbi:uncharacterized protein MONOS_2324 [Monocercomonoides exilis]|uniref:uncharacterized protein n=1 Tax=Monocercomonoides exilis TaxID=2049356 RepID=UPI00355A3928|nr:hypothetical protein MONOS_2324 [Monocercomonoides exilis]|eukprot:MONOS_2324.1-p1 / transcript=MONOS_2324.1 / gene=MONOS_2324 / organism=Monocercomonoides_exilis_PA203 / gene_product=unspecified product / transcript_product=unspecified product / location=Mono_scaffold00047:122916-123959(-) / protein_length=328 / sequence_SO=supercontig / SO=protein_coding / is_pseudo=false